MVHLLMESSSWENVSEPVAGMEEVVEVTFVGALKTHDKTEKFPSFYNTYKDVSVVLAVVDVAAVVFWSNDNVGAVVVAVLVVPRLIPAKPHKPKIHIIAQNFKKDSPDELAAVDDPSMGVNDVADVVAADPKPNWGVDVEVPLKAKKRILRTV